MMPTTIISSLAVVAAAAADVTTGRIPNVLTYPLVVFGLVYAAVAKGLSGLTGSSLGFLVAFVPFFVLYMTGGMGGGDVKLMAALGALLGYPTILDVMVSSILLGGLLALLVVTWEGQLWTAVRFLVTTILHVFLPAVAKVPLRVRHRMPFGAAICLATLLSVFNEWSGRTSAFSHFLAESF